MSVDRHEEAVRIATAFHDEYEAAAESLGWETQLASRVNFDELPEKNRATMLATVKALLDRHILFFGKPIIEMAQTIPELASALGLTKTELTPLTDSPEDGFIEERGWVPVGLAETEEEAIKVLGDAFPLY